MWNNELGIIYHSSIINEDQTDLLLYFRWAYALLKNPPRNDILENWKKNSFQNSYDAEEERDGTVSMNMIAGEGAIYWNDRSSNYNLNIN